MTTELIAGVMRALATGLDGALDGLDDAAARITDEMQHSPAHGDATGASHANYSARAVGRGQSGSAALAAARSAAEALNAAEVGPAAPVSIDAELGVILDSQMTYSVDLETENAGDKAVIGPALGASGAQLTQAAAQGSKRALGS